VIVFFLELPRIAKQKKVIGAVHGGLAQKASVCLFRRRKKAFGVHV
jgi:hypothetical protein